MTVNRNNNRLVIPYKQGDLAANWEVIERWANSQVVNGLIAGDNITLTAQEQTQTPYGNPPDTGIITISATGGGGGGVTDITSSDGTLLVTNPTGPVTDLGVANPNFVGYFSAITSLSSVNVSTSYQQQDSARINWQAGVATMLWDMPAPNGIVVSGTQFQTPVFASGSLTPSPLSIDITDATGANRLGVDTQTPASMPSNALITLDNTGQTPRYLVGTDLFLAAGNAIRSHAGGIVYFVLLTYRNVGTNLR
jgi:hypothetical protein